MFSNFLVNNLKYSLGKVNYCQKCSFSKSTLSRSVPIPEKVPTKFLNKLFINNEFVNSSDGKTFDTINPATCKVITQVYEASKDDVNTAVLAAHEASRHGNEWSKMGATGRGNVLSKLAHLIKENQNHLAVLETLDTGKPFTNSYNIDLEATIECYNYYGGWANKVYGKTIPQDDNFFSFTLREPYGVCAQIVPWNFPLLMQAWKLAPALAAGNTIVMKTAEQTPLTGLFIADLIKKAGFPAGVVNILNGFGETGQHLVKHPLVKKVAFTGSTEVGKLIQGYVSKTSMRPLSLELGGKSPHIVFNDANCILQSSYNYNVILVENAVESSHLGTFLNEGQCCCAGQRVFVHQDIHDEFLEMSIEKAKSRVLGDPFDVNTTHGPLIDSVQYGKVLDYIKSGNEEGARLCTGGGVRQDGYFIEPAIFDKVTDNMRISREEVFGPVMQILKFKDEDEVIERANNTNYGLAAGVQTSDISRAIRVAKRLQAGTVWINCYNILKIGVPFGGYKESGIGRDLSDEGILNYTQVKSVLNELFVI